LIGRVLAASQNRSDAGSHWTLSRHEFPIAGNQRDLSHLHAGDIGDGIECCRSAVERNAEIACARFARFHLRGDSVEANKQTDDHYGCFD
jgi:hypothetical protein